MQTITATAILVSVMEDVTVFVRVLAMPALVTANSLINYCSD